MKKIVMSLMLSFFILPAFSAQTSNQQLQSNIKTLAKLMDHSPQAKQSILAVMEVKFSNPFSSTQFWEGIAKQSNSTRIIEDVISKLEKHIVMSGQDFGPSFSEKDINQNMRALIEVYKNILSNKPTFIIPKGYRLYNFIKGDLNSDKLDDYVLIIQATKEKDFVMNKFGDRVNRNRRGILIYLTNQNKTFLAVKNLSCFDSAEEDGGNYYPPELDIGIKDRKLYIHFSHGRYGYSEYTFRYQDAHFYLIGYDVSDNFGPIVNQYTSINFLTRKKLVKVNTNWDEEMGGKEVFKSTWTHFKMKHLLRLSDMDYIENAGLDTDKY